MKFALRKGAKDGIQIVGPAEPGGASEVNGSSVSFRSFFLSPGAPGSPGEGAATKERTAPARFLRDLGVLGERPGASATLSCCVASSCCRSDRLAMCDIAPRRRGGWQGLQALDPLAALQEQILSRMNKLAGVENLF